jgi:hypothetical protein
MKNYLFVKDNMFPIFFLSWFAIKAGGVGVTGVLYNHLAIAIEEASRFCCTPTALHSSLVGEENIIITTQEQKTKPWKKRHR